MRFKDLFKEGINMAYIWRLIYGNKREDIEKLIKFKKKTS